MVKKLQIFSPCKKKKCKFIDLTFQNAHFEPKLHQRIPILLKNYISIEGLLYSLTILEKKIKNIKKGIFIVSGNKCLSLKAIMLTFVLYIVPVLPPVKVFSSYLLIYFHLFCCCVSTNVSHTFIYSLLTYY